MHYAKNMSQKEGMLKYATWVWLDNKDVNLVVYTYAKIQRAQDFETVLTYVFWIRSRHL